MLRGDGSDLGRMSSRGRLRFLAGDAVLYGTVSAIAKGASLITFPVLARHFSVADYGLLDLYLVVAGLLAVCFTFGQDSAVVRYWYEYDSPDARRQVVSQALAAPLLAVCLATPALWYWGAWAADSSLGIPQAISRTLLLMAPFAVLSNFCQALLKWTYARQQFLLVALGGTVAYATSLLIAVLVFDARPQTVLLVCLGTSIAQATAGIIFVRKWLVWPHGLGVLKQMLPYALPYGAIGVAAAFVPLLERALTERLLGDADLGLYAAGAKIAMLSGLLVSAFQTAWGPFSHALLRDPSSGHTYNQVLRVFAVGICVVTLALSLVAPALILLLASERYIGASVVVFPLAMGLAIQATSWITEVGISLSKRSHLNLYPYLISLTMHLLAIWILASALGLVGVGLGVLIGYASKALVASWLAQRAFPLPWSYRPVVLLMTATTVWGLFAGWLGERFGPGIHAVALAAGILATGLAGWRLLFTARERGAMWELVTRRLGSMIRRA